MDTEIILYKNHEIEIYSDELASSPDEWGNKESFLVYDHRSFLIKVEGFSPLDINDEIQRKKNDFYEGHFVFPVFAYIHSGITLSLTRLKYPFNCPWDTSLRGFILVLKGKGRYTRKQARKIAELLIDEWNCYLSGNIYGYFTPYGSCGGFYGNEGFEEAIFEAKQEIDFNISKQFLKHFDKLKTQIKYKVPLSKRVNRFLYEKL